LPAATVSIRRQIAEVVQPALAAGADFGGLQQLGQQRLQLGVEVGGVMRMQAGGGDQPSRIAAGDGQGVEAALRTGTGDHQLRHTGGIGALQHLLQVVGEGLVAEVGADVDQGRGRCVRHAPSMAKATGQSEPGFRVMGHRAAVCDGAPRW
jgi:hypothetical protein